MRNLLATAVAIAPLMAVMAASDANAQQVVSTTRTTPIATGTANNGQPDGVRIASGGNVQVTSGAAVTVNSSNNLEIQSGGQVTMDNSANGSTGVLVNGGNTANITIGGNITVSDDIANNADRDTDNDGDDDGPFANGSDRYGVRITGAQPLVGNILLEAGSTVTVEGANSYGVSLEAPLTGNLRAFGTVNITGTNSVGVRTTGTVSGNVDITGSVTSRGQGASAISIGGDVNGRVLLQSTASSTGYRYTQRPRDRPSNYTETTANDADFLFLDELDADDVLQGGPAVRVAASVARGVVLDVAPSYANGIEGDDDGDGIRNGDEDDDGDGTKNRDDTDRDGNGLIDTEERSSVITSLGSGPALLIGDRTRAITLGAAGTGNEAFGLINRGTITGSALYGTFTLSDGTTFQAPNATAVQIGDGQAVTIAGGIRNEGAITADSQGNSWGLRLQTGAAAPLLSNTGNISAVVASDAGGRAATAIQIDAGASMASIVNGGNIRSAVAGERADSYAIRDLSGSLTSIRNTGSIAGTIIATDDFNDTDDADTNATNEVITGRAVAIDVSANTSGVTVLQLGENTLTGDTTDSDGDGLFDINEPIISGAVLFGSGADTLDIRNGVMFGDMSFGAGADRLLVSQGAQVRGAVTDSDGNLVVNVTNGTLDARQNTRTNISSLDVGAAGDLIVRINPQANTVGGFNVAGAANIATGAGLGASFESLLLAPGRFTVVRAGTLNVGTIDASSLVNNSPYLYVVGAGVDQAARELYVDARRRTAAESGMITSEAGQFDAFYTALAGDISVRDAFLDARNRQAFFDLYEQTLPDHSGGALLSLASGVDAVTRALTGRNASAAPGETSAWLQEINFYADKDKTQTYGFRSEGFGVAGGVERGTDLGALGVSLAFTSSDIEDPESAAEEVLSAQLIELGLYWRAQGQNWTTWARAAAGYASFDSTRRLVGGGLNLRNTSDWSGYTLAAAGGASYETQVGRFSIRPEAYAEYFFLSEESRQEKGGGSAFDLAIQDREGHLLSAVAAVNIGMSLGEGSWVRPELRVGWRQNISADAGETMARYVSGGPSFTLNGDTIEGGGPLVGLRINVGNELGMLSITADAEQIGDYVRALLMLRASFRF